MKIYIAGKITGLFYEDAMRAFADAAALLKRQGHEPVNPMSHVDQSPSREWADYMKDGIRLLLDCDAIYMLEGWTGSKGATLERRIAQDLGLQMRYAALEGHTQCSAAGCGIWFIQTDQDAEVDLCHRCEAALLKAAA